MKKLFTSLLIFCSVTHCKAQWVTIPDANFRLWLNNHGFSSCISGTMMDTTCNAVVNATSINFGWQGISNLTGIQYFDHLQTLKCIDNSLTFLPNLPASLSYLDCSGNQITSLPNLPSSLTYLNCSGNTWMASLPVLPSLLTTLICNYNNYSSLPSLPSSLVHLNCDGNQITSLPSLPSSLMFLDCGENFLTSLPSLPSSLDSLWCHSNQLPSLPSLPSSLAILYCSDNELVSLPSLPSSLELLECGKNLLTTLPSLSSSLYSLYCYNNQITSLPSLPSSLILLMCDSNELSSLPTLPSSLYSISCDQNLLTILPSLPLSLKGLYCSNNQLISLPIFPDTLLVLNISNNPLLMCLPFLHYFTGYSESLFNISGTGITCLPNIINHTGYIAAIDTMPICSCVYPSGITVTNITSTSAKVNWSAECCLEYRIQYRVTGTTSWITKVAAPPLTTKTLTALAPGTTYDLKMKVVCTNGTSNSAWSPIQTFTTTISCAAPTNLTASNLSQTQATVNWSAVASAYSYKLVKRKLGTTAWSTSTILAPTTSKLLTGLTANTTYQYRLQTICNASGTPVSSWTPIHTFTTMLRLEDISKEVDPVALSIYPNPFINDFELSVTGAESEAIVSVYNIIGQQQLRMALEPHDSFINETISLSGYVAGVYIVSVTVNSENFIRKIVKE